MRYPIAIELGTETAAFGVVVPDLPGCFSAGDTLDEAIAAAEQAVAAWIGAASDAGQDIPAPTSPEAIRGRPDFAGWSFGIITLDPARLNDTTERVNITPPLAQAGIGGADAVRRKLEELGITDADVADAVSWSRHRR